jgi:alkanesulfonate monooxygenase SsuD/methylene tetrahydromethanopterin reductase-like flavin-dependent oxidoreductase (luciferase family)
MRMLKVRREMAKRPWEMRMKFGLFGGALGQSAGSGDSQYYTDFIDYVCEADALGFHSVYIVEHHFTGLNQISSTLSFLCFLAARTQRIRLGTGVTVLPWHNPVLVAEQIATLDLLSNGRAEVGVGKGYRPYEFTGFAIPPDEAQERYDEALEIMLRGWRSKERFSHKGKHWTFNDILVEPEVIQKPHPAIWVGVGSETSIEKAAARDFNILLDQWSPVETLARRVGHYLKALAPSARKSADRIGVTRAVQMTSTVEEQHALLNKRAQFVIDSKALTSASARQTFCLEAEVTDATDLEVLARRIAFESSVVGNADEIIDRLKQLEAAGVEYVLLAELSNSREALRAFAREVMPTFQTAETSIAA